MLLSIILGITCAILIGWLIKIGKVLWNKFKDVTSSQAEKGPNSKDVVGYIFKTKDDKYYKFTPKICPCPLFHT